MLRLRSDVKGGLAGCGVLAAVAIINLAFYAAAIYVAVKVLQAMGVL
jgi:hypothetical protein